MSGTDIYRNFQEGPGSGPLADAAAITRTLVEKFQAQANEIVRLTTKMETAWQGDAAGAAQRGAGSLAVAHLYTAPLINTAQDLTTRQVESFDAAKNAVRPVPPAPTKPSPFSMIFSVDASATYAGQLAVHNAAAQHNVDVMATYESASAFNTSGQPQSYGTVQADGSAVVVRPSTQSPQWIKPAVPASPPPRSATTSAPPWLPVTAPTPGVPTGTAGLPGTGTDAIRGDRADGGDTTGVRGGGTAGPRESVGGVTNLGGSRDFGGRDSGGRNGSETPGGRGAVDGRGNPDGRGEVVDGRGGAVGGRGEVTGGRGEAVGGRGGVAGRGGRSGGVRGAREGLPVVPGGGKGKEEDEEHRAASFLREVDPESVFGTDQRCAPPVIE